MKKGKIKKVGKGGVQVKTERKEVALDQKILLDNGEVDYVEDFDGSFFFLEKSDEPILNNTLVNVVVEEGND